MSTASHSAHIDTFARDHLPAAELQPEYRFDLPALQFPPQLNCAAELLDRHIEAGRGAQPCIQAPGVRWSYAELHANANRIAQVLVGEMGLMPGNRVLLRAPNQPMLAACWFAVMKAGGIAVATMPMLRARELVQVIVKADVTHALCDAALAEALELARAQCPTLIRLRLFNTDADDGLEAAMARVPASFETVATAADDTCIIAFTSGTTGEPKGTMHFHRDVMAVCACWPPHVLRLILKQHFALGYYTNIKTELLNPISQLVSDTMRMPVQANKAIVGSNAFSHSSGIHQDGFLKDALCYEIIKPEDVGAGGSKIVLTARSGRSALAHRFRKLGFDFTRNDIDTLYEQFLKVADSKKEVENEDLLSMAKQFKPETAVV